MRGALGVEVLIAVLVLAIDNAGEEGCHAACPEVTEAAALSMAPVSAVSVDGHVLRISVASTAGGDDHSEGSGGLWLVRSSVRHNRFDMLLKIGFW
jgi:hypothetical protein